MDTETQEFALKIRIPKRLIQVTDNQSYIQEALAASLYHSGILTLKEAREIVGVSRRVFEEEILPKFGYTTMRNNSENINIEKQATNW